MPEVVAFPRSFRFSPATVQRYHPFDAAARRLPSLADSHPGFQLGRTRAVRPPRHVSFQTIDQPPPFVTVAMQRTGSRSSLYGGGSALNLSYGGGEGRLSRSSSRAGGLSRSSSFSPGYIHRSASSQSVFGRTLRSSSAYTPPFHSTALQRSTPHYMDKYPFVRYSFGGSEAPGFGLLPASGYTRAGFASRSETPTMSRYMSSAPLRSSSSYAGGSYGSRYAPSSASLAPTRSFGGRLGTYSGRLGLDSAMDLYKGRCMTVGTLSKYWLSGGAGSAYTSRRERDASLNYVSAGAYNPGISYSYFHRSRY